MTEVRWMVAGQPRKSGLMLGLILALTLGAGQVQAQKQGGVLKAVLRENPPSLLMHEWATVSASWPMMPVYNNLVLYNPAHAVESAGDLVGELADKWTWSDGGKKLTFHLRHGVTWHDGQPFTAKDVKVNFDVVRDAMPDRKLRSSPRKLWFENVKEITTLGDLEVSFVLKRPQPSLLSMLASGYSAVYPAHVDLVALHTKSVGTGPFMLKEYQQDQFLSLVRNPNYFVKGRPYLDGIRFIVIRDRAARAASLIAGDIEVFFPQESTPSIRDQVLAQRPDTHVQKVAQFTYYNLVVNTKKAPLDDLRVRQAINYALDRSAFLETQLGGAVAGGVMMTQPYSDWGLPAKDLAALPGWGDPKKDKQRAVALLKEAGFSREHPLKLKLSTRSVPLYQDMASWMIGQFKEVGVEGTIEIVDSALWFPKLQRGDYELGANMTGAGAEDPDANYFENFSCGSPRNYSFYCNKQVEDLMAAMSQEQNHAKRLQMVRELDKHVQVDVARSMLGQALDFMMSAPYVKGFVAHHSIYSYGRMQEVWLDK